MIKRHYLMAGGAVLLATVLGVTAASVAKRSKVEEMTVPEGTPIHVTLDQAIASDQSRPGDHFEARVSEPVIIDGKIVIPQGAYADGVVVDAHQSGRLKGRARLQLELKSVSMNGQNYGMRTSSSWRSGRDHKKHNWAWIGSGAGGGALIA